MCMSNNRASGSKLCEAFGTTYQFAYTTRWMLLYGADAAFVYEQLQNGGGDADYRQEVFYRTAEVWTGQPSTWSGTGNVRSGIATATTTFSWTSSTSVVSLWNGTSGKAMWIQFAVKAKSNATSWVNSWSRMVVSLDNKAKLVAGRRIQVLPNANDQIVPLSRWLSGQDLTAAMGAFRITGVSGGTLTYQLVARTLLGPGSYPGAWGGLGTAQTAAADKLYNTGDLPVTPGTNLSVQLGLKFSGTVVATVEVAVGARYA